MKRKVITFFILLLVFAGILAGIQLLKFGSLLGFISFNNSNSSLEEVVVNNTNSSLFGFFLMVFVFVIIAGLVVRFLKKQHETISSIKTHSHRSKKLIHVEFE